MLGMVDRASGECHGRNNSPILIKEPSWLVVVRGVNRGWGAYDEALEHILGSRGLCVEGLGGGAYDEARKDLLRFLQELHGCTPHIVLVSPLRVIVDVEAKRIPQANVDLEETLVHQIHKKDHHDCRGEVGGAGEEPGHAERGAGDGRNNNQVRLHEHRHQVNVDVGHLLRIFRPRSDGKKNKEASCAVEKFDHCKNETIV